MNKQTIEDLLSLKQQLQKQIEGIDLVLSINGMANTLPLDGLGSPFKQAPFNSKDSYKEKIAKVLKSENKFLHINQLIDIIHAYTPKSTRQDVKDSVNSAKSALLKEGAIVKVAAAKSNQNSFYGSPNWLEAENTPKIEHMYDETLIKEKKVIEI